MKRVPWGLLAVVLLSGCGRPPLGQVEGVLTRGGKPLHGVQVQFMPDPESGTVGSHSVGMTDERGHFTLRTDEGEPGAVVGVHMVCLVDAAARLNRPTRPSATTPPATSLPVVSRSRFPIEYSSATRTPFQKIVVAEGNQVIDLDIKIPPKR